MIDDGKDRKNSDYKKDEKTCLCDCGKPCYNNKECCYLQAKDINIVQVNDSTLFQMILSLDNLHLTAKEPEINTSGYEIVSSCIQRLNDTLLISEAGVYSIYVSLEYSFIFNEMIKEGDVFRVGFIINGNGEKRFTINNTITVPNKECNESKEIINTIQGQKLQIIGEELPYKINISLKEFEFDKVILNQILITDLILIVKKVI